MATWLAALGLPLLAAPWLAGSMPESSVDFIFSQLRVPRVLVAALVGASLGSIGEAYQALFENPMATPSTTGTTAGSALGALAAIVL